MQVQGLGLRPQLRQALRQQVGHACGVEQVFFAVLFHPRKAILRREGRGLLIVKGDYLLPIPVDVAVAIFRAVFVSYIFKCQPKLPLIKIQLVQHAVGDGEGRVGALPLSLGLCLLPLDQRKGLPDEVRDLRTVCGVFVLQEQELFDGGLVAAGFDVLHGAGDQGLALRGGAEGAQAEEEREEEGFHGRRVFLRESTRCW